MKNEKNRKGFTLVEVLVALTLLGVVMGTVCQIFLSQADAYKTQARITQRQQRLRAALEIIARDFRSAGYPALDPSFLAGLTAWIPDSFIPRVPQTVSLSGVATLTPGGNNPDILSLLIVFSGDTNPTTLSQGALAGDTFIQLGLNTSETIAQYITSDLVYIGKPPEVAQIDKISGSTLIIDTDPVLPGNQGLRRAYGPGTEVGEISLVSYAVFNDHNDPGGKYHDPGVPVLKRKVNAGSFQPLAEDITDLKVNPIKPELFHLQVSVGIGIAPMASQAAKKNILTLSTYIMKRN